MKSTCAKTNKRNAYVLRYGGNAKMTKAINLPELVYRELACITEDLTSLAKKTFSPAMTISLLIEVYRAYVNEPCARDAFRQRIATSDFMSPETFEKEWDIPLQKGNKIEK
jgi:hypothetical protein